jgi:AraC-like DNA-binding protein
MLSAEVRSLVRDMLPLGGCSVEEVAHHLGVDRRTVHRHLARGGETFSSLMDEVRAELAESYLEGNKRHLTEVAQLLGFSALSAFSRWHKRHFGLTLTERRNGKSLGDWPAPYRTLT